MPLTNEAIDAFLDHLMLNSAWANVGDAAGLQPSAAAGVFWLSLHTANPGTSGTQNTSEAAYGSYARVSVARTGAGWTRTGNVFSPVSTISFPAATSGSETETYGGIGSDSSGAGHLLWSGPITPAIAVTTGVTPQLTTASTITLS